MSRANADALVECVNLSKTYAPVGRRGRPVEAVLNVDLRVRDGELIALLGPSGCGKSTLLHLIAGLVAPSDGNVMLRGSAVTGPRTEVGIVFQKDLLLPWRTVLGNVLIQAEVRGLPLSEYRARAEELLASVGLFGFEKALPGELSGGMRQRVSLCRALLHDPDLLLMDEPFGALDALTRDQMNVDLQSIWLRESKTILLVTHSISEAVWLADRVVVFTNRPARIQEVIEVDLRRPRELSDLQSDYIGGIVRHIRNVFEDMGLLSRTPHSDIGPVGDSGGVR